MPQSPAISRRRLSIGIAGFLLFAGVAGCDNSSPIPPPNGELMTMDPGGPVITNAMPPPISGGTLLITSDDETAVAADPDRDTVWVIDLATKAVRARVRLSAGSEPGRVAEDQDGRVHVALRRGGSVVKIDPRVGALISTQPVCAAPRGMAYDAATDNLHVACAGGELVTLNARGGGVLRTLYLDRDLRDVVVKNGHLLISRFRSAEILDLDASGAITGRDKPRQGENTQVRDGFGQPSTSSPAAAWRMIALPGDDALLLHQRALDGVVVPRHDGYSSSPSGTTGLVNTAMTVYGAPQGSALIRGNGVTVSQFTLAVDVAVSRDGQQLALVSPIYLSPVLQAPIAVYDRRYMTMTDPVQPPVKLYPGAPPAPAAQLSAVAFDGKGTLYAQSRNPGQLYIYSSGPSGTLIQFPDAEDISNEGHHLFHNPTRAAIACASCHPEAGDDGHVWNFDGTGLRRTQNLRGGLLATLPLHWDGAFADLTTLMSQVFTERMSGPALSSAQVARMGEWLDAQARLPRSGARDPGAATRGQQLFNDATIGCASCHSGAHLTSNQDTDVGTGMQFQVPSLVDLAQRAPYLHNGCAQTLRDRFNPTCGGGDRHGQTSQLSAGQLDDLLAYLETL